MFELSPQYGTFLPALIEVVTKSKGTVLELGMGIFSTPYLHFACKNRQLVSYESDKKYYDWLKVFESENHQIHFVSSWDNVDFSGTFSVALIDHEPTSRRKMEIKRLAQNTEYIVIHDSNTRLEKRYRYSEVYPLFKYRKDFADEKPNTTILSNFHSI